MNHVEYDTIFLVHQEQTALTSQLMEKQKTKNFYLRSFFTGGRGAGRRQSLTSQTQQAFSQTLAGLIALTTDLLTIHGFSYVLLGQFQVSLGCTGKAVVDSISFLWNKYCAAVVSAACKYTLVFVNWRLHRPTFLHPAVPLACRMTKCLFWIAVPRQ